MLFPRYSGPPECSSEHAVCQFTDIAGSILVLGVIFSGRNCYGVVCYGVVKVGWLVCFFSY